MSAAVAAALRTASATVRRPFAAPAEFRRSCRPRRRVADATCRSSCGGWRPAHDSEHHTAALVMSRHEGAPSRRRRREKPRQSSNTPAGDARRRRHPRAARRRPSRRGQWPAREAGRDAGPGHPPATIRRRSSSDLPRSLREPDSSKHSDESRSPYARANARCSDVNVEEAAADGDASRSRRGEASDE